MIESGGGLGFTQQTDSCLGILRGGVGQQLQSHKAVETRVLRFINDTHATPAEPLDDAVMRDGLLQQSSSLRKGVCMAWGARSIIRHQTYKGCFLICFKSPSGYTRTEPKYRILRKSASEAPFDHSPQEGQS